MSDTIVNPTGPTAGGYLAARIAQDAALAADTSAHGEPLVQDDTVGGYLARRVAEDAAEKARIDAEMAPFVEGADQTAQDDADDEARAAYEELHQDDLEALLRAADRPVSGTKAEQIDRLVAYDKAEQMTKAEIIEALGPDADHSGNKAELVARYLDRE